MSKSYKDSLGEPIPEKSGRGGDSDRLSQSPQAIRHGNKDVFDLGPGEVLRNSTEADEVPEFTSARDDGI